MRSPNPIQPLHRRRRHGLTMMETIVSIAITGMLLTGLASAFVTSADAVEMNEQFFRATQASRVTLNQVLVECRRADALQCSSSGPYDYFDVIRPEEVLEDNEVFRRYQYDAVMKQITLTIHYANDTPRTSWFATSRRPSSVRRRRASTPTTRSSSSGCR
jgi:type II secretory pathway pseudopilin PulG